MGKRAGRNIQAEEAQGPDCCICIKRKNCGQAAENSFCTRFQRREAEEKPKEKDPNRRWARGEEVEF